MLVAMIKRNLKLYFRDRTAVFFSMLGVFIILLLYVLFLGAMVENIAQDVSEDNARFFMDSWIMAGVISATTLTTTLAGLNMMVEDKAKKVNRDFLVAPIPRYKLVLSYVISAICIGVVMSLLTFVIAQIYIVMYGGSILSFGAMLKVIGVIILSVSASSAMLFLAAALIKTSAAFGTLSTLVGTLVGFLTGIYIPIGNLPSAVQTFIKVFPISHTAAAIRQIMMDEAVSLTHVPHDVQTFLGVVFEVNGQTLSFYVHLLVLVATIILFTILSVIVMKRHKEN